MTGEASNLALDLLGITKKYSEIFFSYLHLAAHFLIGFNEAVLMVHHDAIVLSLLWNHPKRHLHLIFLTTTSQVSHYTDK